MAGQPTTQLQVSGYRFTMRRIERALLRGDVQPVHEPLRARSFSLTAGCMLAAIAVTGCVLVALVRPQPALANAPIVMGRQSGALYVRVGETLHPVLNLASARRQVRGIGCGGPRRDAGGGAAQHGALGRLRGRCSRGNRIPAAADRCRVCGGHRRADPG
ncbi:MAG: type VII secretion protein EccB, partial [Mycobacterium sp.]